MTVEMLEKLIRAEGVTAVMQALKNPVLQVARGWDLTNVTAKSIPGAVKFGVWAAAGEQYEPGCFAAGYVVWVNGPMSRLYQLTEGDYLWLEENYPKAAVDGVRNTRIITRSEA